MAESADTSATAKLAQAVEEYERLARAAVAIADELAVASRKLQLLQMGPKVSLGVVTGERILSTVAEAYGVRLVDILSPSRSHELVRARHVAMYLMRHIAGLSSPKIGRLFHQADHTSVLAAVKKLETKRQSDKTLDSQLDQLEEQLRISYQAAIE